MSVRDIILRGLLLGPLILLLIGCNAPQSDNDNEQGGQATMTAISQDPDYGEEVLYSASRGGQITLQGDPMRIGIAGVNEGSYTDEEGNAVVTWTVINAFPTKLDAPTFDARQRARRAERTAGA